MYRQLTVALLLAAILAGCAGRGRGATPSDSEATLETESNDPCYVCHMPFLEEPLAQAHAGGKVWCSTCHGPSVAHIADERIGATPADVSYSEGKIDAMCGECHAPEEHPAVEEETRSARLAAGREAQRLIRGGEIQATAVCTDCHGRHWIPPL